MVDLTGAWVGLDIGTTSSKAVIYDEHGRSICEGRAVTTWRTTAEGVATDGKHLLDEACAALDAAARRAPDDLRILGVGVTSMGETGVLVDRGGDPVAPAIAWHDVRDDLEVELLRHDIGEERFCSTAGKPLRGQFSVSKHRWLVEHVRGVAAATRRFNVAEWIVRGLSGAEVCDRSLACRTGWFDVAANDWWDAALDWSGASRSLMPTLVDAGSPLGQVRAGHPRLHGAVITTAGHDHQAAALGVGALGVGDQLDSSGTAEALVRTVMPDLAPDQLLALARGGITTDISIQPGRWSLLGGTEGGLAMQATLKRLGVDRAGMTELDAAALAEPGSHDLTSPAALWRAAVESATADAVTLHRAMSSVVGPHTRMIATGGWCHSEMVLDSKRRAFGQIQVADVAEAGTRGAATMAARAAGALRDDEILDAA